MSVCWSWAMQVYPRCRRHGAYWADVPEMSGLAEDVRYDLLLG